jgi:SagB-type dehydrogenase family enzyme
LWREYHEATKHSRESLRRSRHYLDWANMPDPFRHYEGVPVLDLPADPPSPPDPARNGPEFLSQLFFYSAAISATKIAPATGGRYALRVNPSSGNLHPTEFYFATRGVEDWPDGLYHYRVSSHMAEQRAAGSFVDSPVTVYLTSIAWREEWKYQNRAYRYCLHDIGHAWQAVSCAAQEIGCSIAASGRYADDDLAGMLHLPDGEWPMLMIELSGSAIPVDNKRPHIGQSWFEESPNRLSPEQVAYPLIDRMHTAAKANSFGAIEVREKPVGVGQIRLPAPAVSSRPFGETVRRRRSALDFIGGARSISLQQLSALLAATAAPMNADFAHQRFIQLYLFIHRVEGLTPGVYRFWPEPDRLDQIRTGDQRIPAAGLSLGQDLAGNACVTFSMIADLDLAAARNGDRGYRYAYFEAGAIGQRLYLAAESLGLGATGIGAFFDDEVNRYLALTPEQGQVVYHFAVGYPVRDPRLEA